eukprot:gene15313-20638_t
MDADLIVLDFNLNIEDIGKTYPNADIIISKDIDSAPFVANSGFIIVRVTEWSLKFLYLWYRSFDINKCADQHAFTWLYNSYNPKNIKEKVMLLPVDALNTDFPCWKNQKESNQILHLAGLTSLYRIEAFRFASENICKVLLNNSHDLYDVCINIELTQHFPHQLGLTKKVLLEILQSLNYRRLNALQNQQNLSKTINNNYVVIEDDLFGLTENYNFINKGVDQMRSALDDIMKYDDDESNYPSDINIIQELDQLHLQLRLFVHETYYKTILNFFITKLSTLSMIELVEFMANNYDSNETQYAQERIMIVKNDSKLFMKILEIIKDYISSGYEMIIIMQKLEIDSIIQRNYLNNINNIIIFVFNNFKNILNDSHYARFLYFHFKCHQLLANSYQYHFTNHNISNRVEWLLSSLMLWKIMTINYGYYGSDYVMADPYKEYIDVTYELSVLLCMINRHNEGLYYFNESLFYQKQTILDYNKTLVATTHNIYDARNRLVEILINAGICSTENQQFEQSIDYFNEAINVIDMYTMNGNNINERLKLCNEYISNAKENIKFKFTNNEEQVDNNKYSNIMNERKIIKTIKKLKKRKK